MTKKKIKENAIILFYEKGYHACSMRDLATLVGIEAASIYSHYSSKQAILADICIPLVQEMNRSMNHFVELKRNSVAQLEEFISYYIDINISRWWEIQIMLNDWKWLAEKDLEIFRAEREQMELQLISILEKGIKHGQIVDMDPEFMANMLLSVFRWRHKTPKKLIKAKAKYADMLKVMLLHGLLTK